MKEDYKKIVDAINIPNQKLIQIKSDILIKNKKSKSKLLAIPIIITAIVIGVIYFRPTNPIGQMDLINIDKNYFLTTIHANDEDYNLTDDELNIEMNLDMLKTTSMQVSEKNGKAVVSIYLPLDIQVKGENVKNIKFSVVEGRNLDFYRVKSLDLFNGDLLKLRQKHDIRIQFKMFDQLRDSDKEKLKERYQLNSENIEDFYYSKIIELVTEYSNLIDQANCSQESLEEYGWLFTLSICQGDEMIIPYNQQEKLNYSNNIYTEIYCENINFTNEKLPDDKLLQLVKEELVGYKIKMGIEYNTGIINEKIITFKEVFIDGENGELENSTIYMEIS